MTLPASLDRLLSRADVWQMGLTLALAPFLHAELFEEN